MKRELLHAEVRPDATWLQRQMQRRGWAVVVLASSHASPWVRRPHHLTAPVLAPLVFALLVAML